MWNSQILYLFIFVEQYPVAFIDINCPFCQISRRLGCYSVISLSSLFCFVRFHGDDDDAERSDASDGDAADDAVIDARGIQTSHAAAAAAANDHTRLTGTPSLSASSLYAKNLFCCIYMKSDTSFIIYTQDNRNCIRRCNHI